MSIKIWRKGRRKRKEVRKEGKREAWEKNDEVCRQELALKGGGTPRTETLKGGEWRMNLYVYIHIGTHTHTQNDRANVAKYELGNLGEGCLFFKYNT